MSVNPTQRHYRIAYLSFKKFNFTVISHAALILFPGLGRHYQSVYYKTALSLDASQDSACFNFSECVRMCDLEESCHYVDRANHCAEFCFVLKVLARFRHHLRTLGLVVKILR